MAGEVCPVALSPSTFKSISDIVRPFLLVQPFLLISAVVGCRLRILTRQVVGRLSDVYYGWRLYMVGGLMAELVKPWPFVL